MDYERGLKEVYKRLCKSAFKPVENTLEGGLKVTCKYCDAVGTVPPAKSTGFVPHEMDCPLMIAEQYLNEPRNLS